MPAHKLYYISGECSQAVHIVLRECGAEYSLSAEKVGTNDFSPELLALNPKKKVPVLVIDKTTVLTEVPAIMTYLSQLAPEKNLLGSTPMETVRAYEWMNWLSGTLHAQGWRLFCFPERFLEDESLGTAREALKGKGRDIIKDCYATIESRLKDGQIHAVGDAFTAVDAYLFVFFRWGSRAEIDMEALYPRYAALAGRVWARDAVKEVLAAEGF
ncbi:glutathione S-transferase GST-6.0 [Penicillium riverlandense]|uniref:glutathione S-transferase GST-6.0 n=1 Tax=Penicillium riverlandense TaxID=1903569 RepID=UPI002547B0FC|nr:glutathione S-transferase GST-6.0 [Penicillium riverlandense]KAJ5819825.1 glutathione S-transferase GST-6.0 [Penicillium riverlandense]